MIILKADILRRVIDEAFYIIETKKTIREIAKEHKISKSTVHKDLRERLHLIDKEIFNGVDEILQNNLNERHLRGGESTRKKYEQIKKS